jgi:hypothetical protein
MWEVQGLRFSIGCLPGKVPSFVKTELFSKFISFMHAQIALLSVMRQLLQSAPLFQPPSMQTYKIFLQNDKLLL